MPVEIDLDHLPPFPKRIAEKLKTIREHLGLTPDEIAPRVGARTGAEILAYENDEDDLLVTVLWGYARLAGVSAENLIYDDRDLVWASRELSQGGTAMPEKHYLKNAWAKTDADGSSFI